MASMLLAVALCVSPAAVDPAWGQRVDQSPSSELDAISIDEKLGDDLADVTLVNSAGEQVTIGDYLELGKPVVINPIYFGCPMLCKLSTQGLVDVLKEMEWTPGQEFTVLTVSFAPDEGPEIAERYREASISALGREEARQGWAFLTGDEQNTEALMASLGFGYEWVEDKGEYAHAAALIVATPDGRISRYLNGVHHDPKTLRQSLVEASDGQIGTLVDQVLWRCLAYDPDAGEYVMAAWTVLRLGGLFTVLVVAVALGSLWFIDIRRRRKTAALP